MSSEYFLLPFGLAPVPVADLENELRRRSGFMIIGGCDATLERHPKPHSLDVWLRGYAVGARRNTRQTTAKLIQELCATGRFVQAQDRDPVAGTLCNSIRLAVQRQIDSVTLATKGQNTPTNENLSRRDPPNIDLNDSGDRTETRSSRRFRMKTRGGNALSVAAVRGARVLLRKLLRRHLGYMNRVVPSPATPDNSSARQKIMREFALWVAVSAAKQGIGVRGHKLYPYLRSVDLTTVLDPARSWTDGEFREWHRHEVERLAADAEIAIGWSAKLVNMLLKTCAYVGGSGHPSLLKVMHPPMDNRLVKAISTRYHAAYPDIVRVCLTAKPISGVKSYADYSSIIDAVKKLAAINGCTLFEIEALWCAAN